MTFSKRRLCPELMDQPDLDPRCHHRALNGLARINLWSRTAASFWPAIYQTSLETPRPLRILDVACGGGDVAASLFRMGRSAAITLDISGVDISDVAVSHARQRARATNANVRFQQLNVLTDPLPAHYDVIVSSLFLHHLDEHAASDMLAKMAGATGRLLLISDLRRDRLGYWLAQIACRTLSSSSVVRTDGPRSVANAFTEQEMAMLFDHAGLTGVQITRTWPRRMMATWKR